MDNQELGELAPENLPETLENIKERLMAGTVVGSYEAPKDMGDLSVENLYDTGHEPETGTARDDSAVLKITEKDGAIHYAKVTYYFRSGKVSDVSFISENEADELIKTEQEYFKKQWEEKK